MKNVMLFAALVPVALLCSCTTDAPEQTDRPYGDTGRLFKTQPTDGKYDANPFDAAGASYMELLNLYRSGNHSPASLSQANIILNSLTQPAANHPWDAATGAYLLNMVDTPLTGLATALGESDLSPGAKAILTAFVADFERLGEKPFEAIYQEITGLENSITESNTLSARDKEVLLTVLSIARHSKSKKCCEDTDWKTSVGNIAAAAAGALESLDQAVYYGVITRIGEYEHLF